MKPRYRVKARREAKLVPLPARVIDPEVIAALEEFRGHAERNAAVAVAIVAVAADGSMMSRYTANHHHFALFGGVHSLAWRMKWEAA